MLDQAGAGLVCGHSVCAIDFFGMDAAAPGPFDHRTGPLYGRSSRDGPAVIFDYHHDGQLVYSSLAEKRVEVVGGRASIAGGKQDDLAALLSLQGICYTARERSQSAHFAKSGQNA